MINGGDSPNNKSRTMNNSHNAIMAWLNSDEQYLPGTLRKVVAFFEAHPDADAVFGDFIYVDADGYPLAVRKEIPLRKSYVVNGFLYVASCTLFYRRKLWDSGLLKLDVRYHYSADADLVLHLLSNGVRIKHLNEVLSLFQVVPGENLSSHDAMYIETELIRQKHGACSWRVVRWLVAQLRRVKRLVHGCYFFLEEIRYVYAFLGKGNYEMICARPKKMWFGRKNFGGWNL